MLHDKRRTDEARRLNVSASPPRGFTSPQHATTVALLAMGAALRLWQYLANSSLWIDEAALARNILERDVTALLGPLDYAQVAPPGFLLIEKAIVSVAGTSEYALRAFPLLSGFAGLLLFWTVARRLFSGWAIPFAVGLFSLGIPFIYFSSQVKQYSSDVAASVLLLLLALEFRRRRASLADGWVLGLAGAAIVWISHTAVFVLCGIGAALVALALTERDRVAARPLLVTCTLWALSTAAVALHALGTVTPSDGEYFRWFWAGGFMPIPPRSVSDVTWLPRKVMWVFGAFGPGLGWTNGGLHYRWSPLFALVMLSGFAVLWRTRRETALFLGLPVLTVVCLSALSVYPFTARLLAFLTPYLLLAMVTGATWIAAGLPEGLRFLALPALAILGGAPVFAAATALPPSWVQHLRPVIEHVRERRDPAENVFVFYGAIPAFGYYATRLGLETHHVVLGRCALDDPRESLRQLDQLRGGHAWVVVTHAQRDGELELMLGYLDQIGQRPETFVVPASNGRPIEYASAYRYDLSDTRRLATASAETYPVTVAAMSGSMARWGCYGVTGGEPSRAG